jgi:hypothetical protein
MDNLKQAWCAGLFEGEGNIHLNTQGNLSATIVNTQEDLLKPFLGFGGNINEREQENGAHKTVYYWRIGGNNIVFRFMEQLMPYFKSDKYLTLCRMVYEYHDFIAEEAINFPRKDHDRFDLFKSSFTTMTHRKGRQPIN